MNVTNRLEGTVPGCLFLVPASLKPGEIARVLSEGCDPQILASGLRTLIRELKLDVLIIDTHPGLNEETLLSFALAHELLILMRPDQQDYEGTGVTVEVANVLNVPHMMIVVNRVPATFDRAAIEDEIERTYNCEVVAMIPHADEFMALASRSLLVFRYPSHPVTALLQQLATRLLR